MFDLFTQLFVLFVQGLCQGIEGFGFFEVAGQAIHEMRNEFLPPGRLEIIVAGKLFDAILKAFPPVFR